MTDKERQAKNAILDSLFKEGIEGRQDEKAIDYIEIVTDLAVELRRADCLTVILSWYEALEQKGISGTLAIRLDFSWANAISGGRYTTKWQWEQPTLASEIFHLRRAVSHPDFNLLQDWFKCACLNNLGNRFRVAGRLLEAIDYWRRVLEVNPNFGMTLCNRAFVFDNYARSFDKEEYGVQFRLWWVAYKEASAAVAPTAVYAPRAIDRSTRKLAEELKKVIESVIDVKAAAEDDYLTLPDFSDTDEERDYRRWCLLNCLFLNPLNDLGSFTVASVDWIELGPHHVKEDAPDTFLSFFNQMKQEFVSARWLLYEGLTNEDLHFSDKEVWIQLTEPKPILSLAIEKIKTAYRTSYSLFDKIGYFMNAYMELGIKEVNVSFRTLWRYGENKPIRSEFDQTSNWGFCALHWLSKDFLEEDNDEVAEPQARGLKDIRNHLEHKYLRVTVAESPTAPPHDLAFMVSRELFKAKALHLLKLARSALIYLAIGVGLETRRREHSRTDVPHENLPLTPDLPDEEKT